MVTRNISFSEGEFYHLYNRGVEKRSIYLDTSDYERFIYLLYLSNCKKSINFRDVKTAHQDIFSYEKGDQLVAIGAYCLMPNHFHILATPLVENGLSTFMNKLGTSYSMYFNKKNDRTGSLFEGTFKAKHADTDEYLKYLFSYIHLNPVKLIQSDWKERGIRNVEQAYKYVENFDYSSLQDYIYDSRIEKKIINPEVFPDYFTDSGEIKENLFDWLALNPDNLSSLG